MGQLTAESRGQVRIAIENKFKKNPTPIRYIVKGHADILCGRRFSKNSRLLDRELNYFYEIELIKEIPIAYLGEIGDLRNLYLYLEPSEKIKYSDIELFEEYVIELRYIDIIATKRKIRIFDLPSNIYFSAHTLGRIYERGNIQEDLLNSTLSGVIISFEYWYFFTVQNIISKFVFPFLNGLLFCELVDERGHSGREIMAQWDVRGIIYDGDKSNYFGNPESVIRIKTFINEDMMNISQSNLMLKMRKDFSDPDFKNSYATLKSDLREKIPASPNSAYAQKILEDLFASEEWIEVCRS